ncbi:MAG: NAD(+)/NADH kinase [Nitrospinota bacterium]|nr:NAD(+)/NADH kinase [Nitrospinota bacterium]
MSCVGVIANPQSGKDIRRLVALASSFSNHEKLLIVRRVLAGLEAAGADEVLMLDDAGALGRAAAEAYRTGTGESGDMDGGGGRKKPRVRLLDVGARGEAEDTSRGAVRMREEGAACIVVLGGDGTSRAAAKGCGRCPLIPLSTGTNNAFSQNWEGTVAGLAAGFYARRPRRYSRQVTPSKRLRVHISGGVDLALVDLAVVNEAFAGSRAVWDIERIESLALTRCLPGGLGLSAVGASLEPVGAEEPDGLWIDFAPSAGQKNRAGQKKSGRKRPGRKTKVLAPVGPGLVQTADIAGFRRISPGEMIEISARPHQVLAFDGEREYVLSEGERVGVELDRKGPRVLDVPALLERAATGGHLSALAAGGLKASEKSSKS